MTDGDLVSLGNGSSAFKTRSLELDLETQEALKHCCALPATERKDGLLALQRIFRSGRRLSHHDFKRISEMFMRLFVDPQLKVNQRLRYYCSIM